MAIQEDSIQDIIDIQKKIKILNFRLAVRSRDSNLQPFQKHQGKIFVVFLLIKNNPCLNVYSPGTYDNSHVKLCKKMEVCTAFGGKRIMKSAIETICIPRPFDRCLRCNEICDGDYWHKDETIYICNICMKIERHCNKVYSKKELKNFKVRFVFNPMRF